MQNKIQRKYTEKRQSSISQLIKQWKQKLSCKQENIMYTEHKHTKSVSSKYSKKQINAQ